jgi:GT2 family glycosyltransferase
MNVSSHVVKECVFSCSKFDALVIPEKSIGQGYWARVRAFERTFVTGSVGDTNVEAARFFKKSVLKKIGGYDPKIVGAEDWDLHQRALQSGVKIGRIKHYIIHEEGKLHLKRLLMKKAYYGKAFLLYKKRYPEAFKKSVLRTALLKNTHKILMKPYLGIGVFALKFLEGIALLSGMFLASKGIRFKHY